MKGERGERKGNREERGRGREGGGEKKSWYGWA